jgi:hypothetical protein
MKTMRFIILTSSSLTRVYCWRCNPDCLFDGPGRFEQMLTEELI